MTDYTPIEEYGIIGNLETCALVGSDGSIDWAPFPHVESPSIFASILDAESGGRFAVRPAESVDSDQQYIERTNVLRTTFETASGRLSVTDFMPVVEDESGPGPRRAIYRKVTCVEGSVDVELTFDPQFDYARAETTVEEADGGALARGDGEQAFLSSPVPLLVTDEEAAASFSLSTGETVWFGVQYGTRTERTSVECERLLGETVGYWRRWSHTCEGEDCAFEGPWHDLAVRSGLVLKLLTHHETGAICAAPTTSLPEDIGGVRNWDYRYNWLRDSGFTIQALANLGHLAEAREYCDWYMDRCHSDEPADMQPLYGLHGDTDLPERELDHLSGYRDSAPVRIGNGAADQRQLDIYGELVLALYETVRHGEEIPKERWTAIREVIDYVCEVWEKPDAGIWEVRGGPEQFVYSKVMCWVALDRGIEMAESRDLDAPLSEWRSVRSDIKETVLERGFDEELNSFTQSFDGSALDATGLLIPVVGFLPFDDERVRGTIDATSDRLVSDGGLVKRYDCDDGLPGEEGAFVWCSFWLINVLALSGRVEEARERFEAVVEYVSPLGLLAEEIDPEGTHLGNFPQAFSHIGLINSALYLGKAMGEEQPGPEPVGTERGQSALPGDE